MSTGTRKRGNSDGRNAVANGVSAAGNDGTKCSYGLGGRGRQVSENGAGRSSSKGCRRVRREPIPPPPFPSPDPLLPPLWTRASSCRQGRGYRFRLCLLGAPCDAAELSLRRVRTARDSAEKGGGRPRRRYSKRADCFLLPSPALVAEDGGGVGCPPSSLCHQVLLCHT